MDVVPRILLEEREQEGLAKEEMIKVSARAELVPVCSSSHFCSTKTQRPRHTGHVS